MKDLLLAFGVVLQLMVTEVLSQNPELTPLSFTSYIGSSDKTFQCHACQDTSWFIVIDGLNRGSKELTSRGIVTTDSIEDKITHVFNANVTIEAILANNNTSIWCAVVTFAFDAPPNSSKEGRFYVQGFLDQPPNMNVTPISGSLFHLLAWDPPFTLDITNVHPDIEGYEVCSNLTTNCTYINITQHGNDSSDLRQYRFPSLRIPIEFNVTAINIVGVGEPGTIHYQPPCDPNLAAEMFSEGELDISVQINPGDFPTVKIVLQTGRQCLDVYTVLVEEVARYGGESGLGLSSAVASYDVIPEVSDAGEVSITIPLINDINVSTNSTLTDMYNMFYNATLLTREEMEEVGHFTFHTYDVQNVNITVDNGIISVVCEFAEGSHARGCYVQITKNGNSSTEQDIVHTANLTWTRRTRVTDQMTIITGLESGKYMVMVFDLESDGSVATAPMYIDQFEIPIILPSPSSMPGPSIPVPTVAPGPVKESTTSFFSEWLLVIILGGIVAVLIILVLSMAVIVVLLKNCQRRRGKLKINEKKQHVYATLTPPSEMAYQNMRNGYDMPDEAPEVRNNSHRDVETGLSTEQTEFEQVVPTYDTIDDTKRNRNANNSNRTQGLCTESPLATEDHFYDQPLPPMLTTSFKNPIPESTSRASTPPPIPQLTLTQEDLDELDIHPPPPPPPQDMDGSDKEVEVVLSLLQAATEGEQLDSDVSGLAEEASMEEDKSIPVKAPSQTTETTITYTSEDPHEEEVATGYVAVQVQSDCQFIPQMHTDVQYSEVSHEKTTRESDYINMQEERKQYLVKQLNGALPINGTDILLTPELIGTCVLLPAQE